MFSLLKLYMYTYIYSYESFTPSYRKMHVHPATIFASVANGWHIVVRATRPSVKISVQARNVRTQIGNVRWKCFGVASFTAICIDYECSFVRSFNLLVDVDVDIAESRSSVRRTTEGVRSQNVADDDPGQWLCGKLLWIIETRVDGVFIHVDAAFNALMPDCAYRSFKKSIIKRNDAHFKVLSLIIFVQNFYNRLKVK